MASVSTGVEGTPVTLKFVRKSKVSVQVESSKSCQRQSRNDNYRIDLFHRTPEGLVTLKHGSQFAVGANHKTPPNDNFDSFE